MSSQRAKVEEVINEINGKAYLPPCQVACPVGEDIQRTNVMISLLPPDAEEAYSRIIEIGNEIYEKNPLFTVCGYVCGLCEKECNYKDQTGAVRRRMLKRFLTDYYLSYLDTKPPLPSPTKEKVAVIGGGPGGLMCAYMLSKNGYQATIIERSSQLGGALRYIPQYRLPKNILDTTLNNLVRIAHIKVELGVRMGSDGKALADLKDEGYRAAFIATGTTVPSPLTIDLEVVAGVRLLGVMFGLNFLYNVAEGRVPPQLFQGKRVVVVGGGNVAFDVARTARRLGGDVSLVCLESEDKSSKDGIPADVEEIEGGTEEGIKITYSRGVEEIMGEDGRFKNLDQLTLMSNRKEGIFIGGDVRRVGFAAEAMRDGIIAAESIDRYLKGEDLKAGREKEYESAVIPKLMDYKPQPELVWAPVEDRLNFEPFEKAFTLEEAVQEARRCLCCGPCKSCKGCVVLELQPEIPEIEVNKDLCSGCKICVAVCPYDAARLEKSDAGLVAIIDDLKCKRCGLCVTACPAGAITIKDSFAETVADTYALL